jgi:hypothetical protein
MFKIMDIPIEKEIRPDNPTYAYPIFHALKTAVNPLNP